ncbi:hypothetical protein A2W14_01205 [Candidatus Gottesmanbacteria bacterium RBG_16_37_8]|uniref:Resuscitation-promoting factor core lysozyme-like domain-containing protein n=1 Tax=Candidatus Gottesmanbacteria bacterium RBG_16_37_8 TaxID=1798371 RepID=A0A1F5YR21_9BACT|nr:MAG: hypothetical protein A2W14_01205 [Candidatus Gottesmanbacteria bacterium RBG_16_37_8]
MRLKFYSLAVIITLLAYIFLVQSIIINNFTKVISQTADLNVKAIASQNYNLEYIVISETPIPTRTPTPTLTPTITPTPKLQPSHLDSLFEKYSREFSVDRNTLKKIAVCESGLNSGANSGTYGGLYQFSASSWISTRKAMNADTNPDLRFNGDESIKTAAFKLSTGGAGIWPNCSK